MTNTSGTTRPWFKKILLATDFSLASQAAFEAALRLCILSEASLDILNVFEYARISSSGIDGHISELDSFYKDAERSLYSLIQYAGSNGVPCEGRIESGMAHVSIVEAAVTGNIDVIVLGTRSIHGFERLVFGSTAEAVLRKATCPVLTVGPQAAAEASAAQAHAAFAHDGVVVFPTDFHVSTTEALCYAASFSAMMHLPLHCLHVLPRVLEDGPGNGAIPCIITEALRHLVGSLDKEMPLPICAVTYGSEISNAVVKYARKHHAKLIVLGVRRASLTASHIPAHISYRVIAEAPCPLLTMAFPRHPQLFGDAPFSEGRAIGAVRSRTVQ